MEAIIEVETFSMLFVCCIIVKTDIAWIRNIKIVIKRIFDDYELKF